MQLNNIQRKKMISGMNKKLYKMLCVNFNKEPDKDMYELLEETLYGYDDYLIKDTIDYIIKNDKYMPNIARIIEVLKSMPNERLTDKQKIKRWEEKGIHPNWLDIEIKREPISDEDLKQLENLMKKYKEIGE